MQEDGLFLCLRIPKSGSQSLTRGLKAAFMGRHIFYVPNTLDPDSRVSVSVLVKNTQHAYPRQPFTTL